MKRHLIKYFAALLLILAPVASFGQKKVYTKKMKIEDFTTRTTKVVVSGESLPDLSFRDEVSAIWNISAYEFCTPTDYEKLKENNQLYFLRLVTDGDLIYISLSKGGKEKESNTLKKPFEIVRIPVSTADMSDGRMITYMPAFVGLVQDFMEKALVNEVTAYAGPTALNSRITKNEKVILTPAEEADAAFNEGRPGTLVAIVIGKYGMIFDAETQKLRHYTANGKDLLRRYGESSE